MRWDLKIRKVQTASGATAVQVVQNKGTGRSFPDFIHLLIELARKANKIKGSFCFCLCSA